MFKPFTFRSINQEIYTINTNQITFITEDSHNGGTIITLSCGTRLSCGFSMDKIQRELKSDN